MTRRARSRPPPVIFASPVAQPPSRLHSSRISGPPARWIAPSTPPPPRSVEFAAFTIASVSGCVMSPRTSSMVQAAIVRRRTGLLGRERLHRARRLRGPVRRQVPVGRGGRLLFLVLGTRRQLRGRRAPSAGRGVQLLASVVLPLVGNRLLRVLVLVLQLRLLAPERRGRDVSPRDGLGGRGRCRDTEDERRDEDADHSSPVPPGPTGGNHASRYGRGVARRVIAR